MYLVGLVTLFAVIKRPRVKAIWKTLIWAYGFKCKVHNGRRDMSLGATAAIWEITSSTPRKSRESELDGERG